MFDPYVRKNGPQLEEIDRFILSGFKLSDA
jgi:hypothetical protein